MAFGDLVKRIFVPIKVDGAAEAKQQIQEVGRAAGDIAKNYELGIKVDSRAANTELRALALQLRALKLASAGDSGGGSGAGDKGGGGILGKLFGGLAGGGGSGLGSGIPVVGGLFGATGPLVGLGIAAAALTALAFPLQQLITGLAAAATAFGAFGALALPTITGLTSGISGLSTATGNYQAASQTLDIAIHKSHADLQAYHATIRGLEPDLQNAARLLTNQNAQWQNLSPAMQKSVIALSDNSAALKNLLPDQRTALTALLAQRTAWESLSPAQQKAATAWSQLSASFSNMSANLAPAVLGIVNTGLRIANQLMPALMPFATAGAKAIEGMAKSLAGFFQLSTTHHAWDNNRLMTWTTPTGFGQFVTQMQKLSGPALTAIGKGIGNIALALSTLFSKLSPWDIVHTINIVSDTIAALIRTLGWLLREGRTVWDWLSRTYGPGFKSLGQDAEQWWRFTKSAAEGVWTVLRDAGRVFAQVGQGFRAEFDSLIRWNEGWYNAVVRYGGDIIRWFQNLPATINHALSSLYSMLFSAGKNAISGLINGLKSIPVIGTVLGIAGNIVSTLKGALHIGSPSRAMYDMGVNITQGLVLGMLSGAPAADAASRRLAAIVTGAGAGSRVSFQSAPMAAYAAAAQYGGGGYVININGGFATKHEIALEVEKVIKQLERHRGGRRVFG